MNAICTITGFILTYRSYDSDLSAYSAKKHTQIELWLATDTGPVQVFLAAKPIIFFIQKTDQRKAAQIISQNIPQEVHLKPLALQTFKDEPLVGVYCQTKQQMKQICQAFKTNQIECFEDDIRPEQRFLMERFIQGSVQIIGDAASITPNSIHSNSASLANMQTSASSQASLVNPSQSFLRLTKAKAKSIDYQPDLSWVSLDLECSETQALYSIGLDSPLDSRVIMIDESLPQSQIETTSLDIKHNSSASKPNQGIQIQWVKNEKELLVALIQWFNKYNPDLILGWNIIDFDCRLLYNRALFHHLALTLGRDGTALKFHHSNHLDKGFVHIAGRLVLDGIHVLKNASYHFASWQLDFVAKTLLNQGKHIQATQDKGAEITRLFLEDKLALAKYNLQDCKLVSLIFKQENLIEFCINRMKLTGLPMDRMGGSVAAFTNLYLPKLHRAGFIAPNLKQNQWHASPGGYVMDSKPGLYDSVIVLDFKSLYPSIIRTFLIDPLGLIKGLKLPVGTNENEAVEGFRGGQFHRYDHFLPEMINRLWQEREKAKQANQHSYSKAIKIIMNSFYGVLGASGCRFFDERLASSITMRGHEIIKKTRDWLNQKGHNVIYGDTDSLFVAFDRKLLNKSADKIANALATELNLWWKDYLMQEYRLHSLLEIEYETHYQKFFMPTIRGQEVGSKKRYCGLIQTDEGEQIIFKGLESARSDWTQLAQVFQKELYKMIFKDLSPIEYIRLIVSQIYQGQHDQKLVYQKRLRRSLDSYTKNIPPHVKAARLADQTRLAQGLAPYYQNKGVIRYFITLNGPQAELYQTSPIDYQHYIDKQIKPIANAILPFIHLDFDDIITSQIRLF